MVDRFHYYYSLSRNDDALFPCCDSDGRSAMTVLSLFPAAEGRPLAGLYLGLNLHRLAEADDILIYSNYITSLDGRISLTLDHTVGSQVPADIINRRDWRLYQELAAQADVMITSARYFRQLAKGEAQDLLPVGQQPEYADILAWRETQGLKSQPDILILSSSLDIPVAALKQLQERRILIFTGNRADPVKIAELEAAGAELFVMETPDVSGIAVKNLLIQQGFRSAYMIAGPQLHQTLIADRVLNRIFLTTRFRLIGGASFDTIVSGEIGGAADLKLLSLYLDQNVTTTQIFAQYALQQL